MLGYKKLLYSKLTENFQDGCDTIVAGCTTYGAIPVSNSPTDIVNAIKKIYTDRYNSGVNGGKSFTLNISVKLHSSDYEYGGDCYVYITSIFVNGIHKSSSVYHSGKIYTGSTTASINSIKISWK